MSKSLTETFGEIFENGSLSFEGGLQCPELWRALASILKFIPWMFIAQHTLGRVVGSGDA